MKNSEKEERTVVGTCLEQEQDLGDYPDGFDPDLYDI